MSGKSWEESRGVKKREERGWDYIYIIDIVVAAEKGVVLFEGSGGGWGGEINGCDPWIRRVGEWWGRNGLEWIVQKEKELKNKTVQPHWVRLSHMRWHKGNFASEGWC